jgi:hypothetical protein
MASIRWNISRKLKQLNLACVDASTNSLEDRKIKTNPEVLNPYSLQAGENVRFLHGTVDSEREIVFEELQEYTTFEVLRSEDLCECL